MKRMILTSALMSAVVFAGTARAQVPLFDTPRVSPHATVSQRIGLTDITVDYHRPAVNGRPIWGGLVPYGQVWRAGANENTTISFSSPVTVGGKELAAGTYGLHVLPAENKWTFIFSNQSHAWGSFSYDASEDAARVEATPSESRMTERLVYTFDDLTDESAQVTLTWEKKTATFKVAVDVNAVVVQSLREGLRGLPRFGWQGWQQAATWCINHDTNMEEATAWLDRSIAINANFSNMSSKARILRQQGRTADADKMMTDAQKIATEGELNNYGYSLLTGGKVDEAIDIFSINVRRFPKSWNVYDSIADGYKAKGDTPKAIANFEKALSLATDDQQKQRIAAELAKLKETKSKS